MEEGVVDVQGAEVGEGWKDPKVADEWAGMWGEAGVLEEINNA